jgi:hypothetical protein
MLIGNYSVLNKSPGRWLGGTSAAHASGVGSAQVQTRANWGEQGSRRNFAMQDRSTLALDFFSIPDGYLGRAYLLPLKAGALSSHEWMQGVTTLSAAMAAGKNGVANLTGTGTLTATGRLVVSGQSALSGAGTITAVIRAARGGTAAITAVGTVTGTARAKGNISAALSGSSSMTATRYATGKLTCAISPFTTLSPQTLASQILDAEDIETSMSVRQALRLIAAATAGKVSGASGTTITIRSAVADSKNRIIATVDGAGNRTALEYDLTD